MFPNLAPGGAIPHQLFGAPVRAVDNYRPLLGENGRPLDFGYEPQSVVNDLRGSGVGADNWVDMHRPYRDDRGVPCVSLTVPGTRRDGTPDHVVRNGRRVPYMRRREFRVVDLLNMGYPISSSYLGNATTLRKDDWIEIDRAVLTEHRTPLEAWSALESAVSVNVPGMSKATYEYEAMSDPGEAIVDMDGLGEGRGDNPLFLLRSVPLYITHSDFHFGERRLMISANSGQSLDVLQGEAASRRCSEHLEDTTLGIATGITYGTQTAGYPTHDLTSTVFGLSGYTNRNTKNDFTAPTDGGWTPETTYNEVLAALETLRGDNMYGPFLIIHSTDFDQYMERVFSYSGGNHPGATLRSMLKGIAKVSDVILANRLSSTFTMHIIDLNRRTVRALIGMRVRTIQWETRGGMQQNFKVMFIQVPLFLSDYSGRCGLLHGTTA